MRPVEEVQAVLALVNEGLNDCQIARRAGIPRSTVRHWRYGQVPRPALPDGGYGSGTCRVCGHPEHEFTRLRGPSYAYLLGIYLGDGFIARHRRRVFRLRIYLDLRYPRIIEECASAVVAITPGTKVSIQRGVGGGGAAAVGCYSRAWPCLLPQHGPGMKHTRKIALTDWQQQIVDEHTEPFLPGLIHSDGCRHLNRIRHGEKIYEYPRYQFSNASDESVARLDEFIGPKR